MKAEDNNGGENIHGNGSRRRHAQRGVGHRNDWRKLAVGGCGQCPGGRRTAPGEEVVSGCDREVWR